MGRVSRKAETTERSHRVLSTRSSSACVGFHRALRRNNSCNRLFTAHIFPGFDTRMQLVPLGISSLHRWHSDFFAGDVKGDGSMRALDQ